MKLYNLFEQVILEEIQKHQHLIIEGVSETEIMDVIKGDEKNRHFHVSFNYTNKKGETGNRWVQVYQLVTTTTGAPAISGYEVSSNIGGNANKRPGWKIYLLSNISNFKVSKVPFYNEIDKVNPSIVYNTINSKGNNVERNRYNKTGNETPTISILHQPTAQFNYDYKNKITNKPADIQNPIKAPVAKPITATPAPVPASKPIVRAMKRVPVAKPIVKTATSGIINKPEIEPEEIGSEEEEENLNVR